jgi:hypothetical protein
MNHEKTNVIDGVVFPVERRLSRKEIDQKETGRVSGTLV